MQYNAPGKCPVCGERLTITKLSCRKCHTNIEGQFNPCEFCSLPKEDLHFLKTFIKCKGSIKEVEREMGISYPTVKGKLNNLIEALGFHVEEEVDAQEQALEREHILSELEQGKINAAQATQRLNALKS
ncbi:DUF2089 domain-containing protein [Vallitaleaceae bacterium 9-2]